MLLLQPREETSETSEPIETDLAIIGMGPAGLTAAIYGSRSGLNVVVIGKDYGGQMALATEIENYPGFKKISGMELADRMKDQAETFGAKVVFAEVNSVEKKEDGHFLVKTDMENYIAKALILATGGRHRELEVPGEKEFIGRGVSYCATCDAAFFKDKTVIVAGSGDAAATGALALSDVGAKKVYWASRSDYLKCEKIYIERARERDNIEILFMKQIAEIKGTNTVEEVVFTDGTSLKVDGVFVEVGSIPNTELAEQLGCELENGLIKVNELMETTVQGVFAAGDVTSMIKNPLCRQITTSVGQATIAAISAAQYLQRKA